MNTLDKKYLDLVRDILDNGVKKQTRAGEVISVFGRNIRHSASEGFPLLTTKKVFSRGMIHELLWFIKGSTNIKYLVDNNVHIWDDDAYRHYNDLIKINNDDPANFKVDAVSKETFIEYVKQGVLLNMFDKKGNHFKYTYGDLGPVYGKQWRNFGVTGRDQLKDVINTLKTNPDDRRMLVIAFNPDVLDDVALPPCHILFQFYTKPLENGKRELSLMWTQRSCDFLLGIPLNISSYFLLLSMVAHICDMEVGELIGSFADTHIYTNQLEGANEQLSHDPYKYELPTLWLNPEIKNIDDFTIDDIKIENYESYPKIYFPLSVG